MAGPPGACSAGLCAVPPRDLCRLPHYQDPGATLEQNRITDNNVRNAKVAGILLDKGTQQNRVDSNQVVNSGLYGISAAGSKNKITDNTALGSGIWDLEDLGSGNKWKDNHYETSSW